MFFEYKRIKVFNKNNFSPPLEKYKPLQYKKAD